MIINENEIKEKGLYLEFLIFKAFVGVLKQMHTYHIMRFSLGQNSSNEFVKATYNRIYDCAPQNFTRSGAVPLSFSSSLIEAIYCIKVDATPRGGQISSDDEMAVQASILMKINFLVCTLVANIITNEFEVLDKISERVFKTVCSEYFGENFNDLSKEIEKRMRHNMVSNTSESMDDDGEYDDDLFEFDDNGF